MKRILSVLLLLSALTLSPWAKQDWTPSTPVRILLTVTEDLSTSTMVTWRTSASAAPAVGQIALASPDPRQMRDGQTVSAKTTEVPLTEGAICFYHSVKFTNLKPKTLYAYRVGDGKVWSEWIEITTAAAVVSNKVTPFNFIYFGDAQNEVKSMWSRAIRKAFRELPYSSLMVHAGDLIDTPNNDNQWGEWFYAGGWIHGSVPTLATPGNHEYARVPGQTERVLSKFWTPQFSNPKNGIPQLPNTNYFVDYQGARIISLDSNRLIKEQAVWLEKNLKNNPNKWTFVTFHHPVFSTARGRDNKDIRDAWREILVKNNVAVVLQGHDHTYGRKNVPTGIKGIDAKSGTVFVVSVSGPKMYRLDAESTKDMRRVAEFTQLYQIVRVSSEKVRFEAYTINGELYDAFELTKNKNGTNQFRDVEVKTPARVEKPPAPVKSGN